jgi:hypothetical protein
LLGRIQSDTALLEKSGLLLLEERLAQDLIPARHTLIRNRVVHEMSARVENSYNLIKSKVTANQAQIDQLKQLGNRNLDAIHKLVSHVRAEKTSYDKELEGFEVSRAALTQQANTLLGHLNMKSIDASIEAVRKACGLRSSLASVRRGCRACRSPIWPRARAQAARTLPLLTPSLSACSKEGTPDLVLALPRASAAAILTSALLLSRSREAICGASSSTRPLRE